MATLITKIANAGVSGTAGDDVIATGPHEGRERLAELCGWRMVEDEDDPTGQIDLKPLRAAVTG